MQIEDLSGIGKQIKEQHFPFEFHATLVLDGGVVSGIVCDSETYEEGLRQSIHDQFPAEIQGLRQLWKKLVDESKDAPTDSPTMIYLKNAQFETAAGKSYSLEWWCGPCNTIIAFKIEVQKSEPISRRGL